MIDEQDVKDWERLPLVSGVITSAHMGAWLYYRDKRRDIQRDKQIRVDAIDQIEKLLLDRFTCDDLRTDWTNADIRETIHFELEQLKEK